MLKLAPRSILMSVHVVLALALALPPAHADPRPSSSFKSGFSSQRSSSSSSSSSSSRGGFGTFGKRSSSASSSSSSAAGDAAPARARNGGGFGSFGGSPPPDARKSDSALSRKLDRDAAAARALRTLDERRAAQAARNAPPPAYDGGQRGQADGGRRYDSGRYDNRPYDNRQYDSQPPAQGRQGSGLGHVIAGAVIANAAANAAAHAANNAANHGQAHRGGTQPAPQEPMPAPTWNGGVDGVNAGAAGAGTTVSAGGTASGTVQPAPGTATKPARGASVFGTIASLALLACITWGVVALVRRARRKRSAAKPNYSFERN